MTSPALPELITEGDTVEDALENVRDALAAVLELYHEEGRALPPNLAISDKGVEPPPAPRPRRRAGRLLDRLPGMANR